MGQGLDPGMYAAGRKAKEMLVSQGFSEEECCEILIDLIADFIVDGAEEDFSVLRERLGHWSIRICTVAADKSVKNFGPSVSRVPPVRPPPLWPPGHRARAFPAATPGKGGPFAIAGYAADLVPPEPPPPQRTTASTGFTIDGRRVPAFVQKQPDDKWTVLICYGNWEPGQILKSVERGEYGSEEAAKKALEAAAEDLCVALEPWIPSSGS